MSLINKMISPISHLGIEKRAHFRNLMFFFFNFYTKVLMYNLKVCDTNCPATFP